MSGCRRRAKRRDARPAAARFLDKQSAVLRQAAPLDDHEFMQADAAAPQRLELSLAFSPQSVILLTFDCIFVVWACCE